jgi:pimeloyl-ACP methyl ester carboxylesterase
MIEGPNAIASLEAVRLGEVDQWLLMRGRDRSSPVLLYVHGGPGGPFTSLAREYSSRLEEHFVVVHWDQRGAGKSCSSDVPDESLRLEQYVADTLELVEWLRTRFGVEKIYLLGHSWGSVLGVLAVQRHPSLFEAYIGLGQVVDQRRGEEISYRWVVGRAEAEGNDEALGELREIQPPYRRLDELILQRKWLGHYGGAVYEGGFVPRFVRALFTSPEYTLWEKLSFYGCFLNSIEKVWFDLEGIDFIRSARKLDVPVYFFAGRHDYNTPFELVVEWAEMLEAPHVEIVWFEDSAHNALIEEPERFQDELIDRVLASRPATTR